MPSREFMEKVKMMEDEFKAFHGESVYLGRDPISRLAKQICQKITVEEDISMLFSKTRLFIRVKYLNEKLNVEDTKLRRKFRCHLNKLANWNNVFQQLEWKLEYFKIDNSVFSWFTVLLVGLEQNSHVIICSELSKLTLSRHYLSRVVIILVRLLCCSLYHQDVNNIHKDMTRRIKLNHGKSARIFDNNSLESLSEM